LHNRQKRPNNRRYWLLGRLYKAGIVPCISIVPAYNFQVPFMADKDKRMTDVGDGDTLQSQR
jgi:hypothetical protein